MVTPSTDQIARVLGDDGGIVCANPNGALTRGLVLNELTNGAAGPGRRPIIVEDRVLKSQLLIIGVYCPDELPNYEKFVDGLETVNAHMSERPAGAHKRADDHGVVRARRTRRAQIRRRSAAVPGRGLPSDRRIGCGTSSSTRVSTTCDWSSRPTAARRSSGSRACADPSAPTVLLYAHYDVQPPLDDAAWRTPPFELHEVDGRWYGRGAADCKGNILMHLVALRALGDDIPVNLRLVVEGSEEAGTGGLEAFVAANPELFRADAILVCDTGNAAVGKPAATVSLRGMVNVVVTVEALASEIHSGMFGGPGSRRARCADRDARLAS